MHFIVLHGAILVHAIEPQGGNWCVPIYMLVCFLQHLLHAAMSIEVCAFLAEDKEYRAVMVRWQNM
jgi:hypothetical protein